jgi:hypothetical protein
MLAEGALSRQGLDSAYTWLTILYVVASILGTACGGFVCERCDFVPMMLRQFSDRTAVGDVYPELEGAAGIADGDRIGGILDPRPPAAVVDGDCGPAHQIGVEERFTGTPSRATVKRDAFVRGDAPGAPLGSDVMIVAHSVIDIAIMIHAQGG